jgi:hypothetical protein
MDGLRIYKKNLEQVLNKIIMGNERERTRLFGQYSGHSIISREEPTFRSVSPVYGEKMPENNYQFYNNKFAEIMNSLVGTSYLYEGDSRNGTDCSRSIILALQEMGFNVPDVTAKIMSSGELDWLYIIPSDKVDVNRSGEVGMINFYDFNIDGSIDHVNVGVRRIGTPYL